MSGSKDFFPKYFIAVASEVGGFTFPTTAEQSVVQKEKKIERMMDYVLGLSLVV